MGTIHLGQFYAHSYLRRSTPYDHMCRSVMGAHRRQGYVVGDNYHGEPEGEESDVCSDLIFSPIGIRCHFK